MANEIKIDLSLSGEQAVARGLDNVGDKAEHAGDDFQKMARDAGFLDKRIGELRGEIGGLIRDFDQTGDLDLLKKINAGNRDLGKFTRLQKQFSSLFAEVGKEAVDVGIKVGVDFGGGMLSNAAKTLANSKALLIGGLVGLAATITPFLGGVIGSAILGGTGIGGIIGGVVAASKDARVQDAAVALGSTLSQAFQSIGTPFIGPIIKVLEELAPIGTRIASDLGKGIGSLAPVLLPLAHGITDLIQTMMPGLTKAMEDAKPVIRAIANELPDIGHALSTFFADIGDHSDEAVMAFITLSKVIQTIITHSGRLIAGLSELFEITVRVASKIAPVIEAIYGWIPIIGDFWKGQRKDLDEIIGGLDGANDSSRDFAGGLKDVKDSATAARNRMLSLNEALLDFLGIMRSSEQANINYERTWDEMIETLAKGKRTLDITTEAGRENREAIEAHADAIAERHRQRIEEGMTLQQALPIMDAEIERLRKQLLSMGYNKEAANELINIYAKWPTRAVTVIEAQGLEATKESIAELISMFRLANNMTIGGIGGVKVGGKRVAGGPVLAGQTYLVGEQGPELLTMGAANGTVVNAAQTAAMMSGASGGAAGPVVVVGTLKYVGPPGMTADIAAALISLFQVEIAAQGGNVQTVLGQS